MMATYEVRIDHERTKRWYKPGTNQLHRTDGPAVKWASGSKEWWIDGERHRTDGPAVEWADGSKEYWVDGKKHREDGPAVVLSIGHKEWWINGQLHRTDGPAMECANGTKQWWINGEYLTEEAFNNRNRPLIGEKVTIGGKDYVLA